MMTKDWTWTAPADSMCFRADRLYSVNGIEVAPCEDVGGGILERTEDSKWADVFSVYFHWQGEGAECIADRNSLAEAVKYATEWAVKLKMPLYVCGEPESWPHLNKESN